jgi:NADPH:quinone reductase-like Zn-dependent oxidoreductase
LLESFRGATGQRAVLACCLAGGHNLSGPSLAYLWDHQVSGRPVFPGAGYFEAAGSAAGILAAAGTSGGTAATDAALADLSIVAPLLLPQAASLGPDALILQVSFATATGALALQSVHSGSGKGRPTVHVEASVAFVVARQPQRRGRAAPAAQPQPAPEQLGPGRQLLAQVAGGIRAASFAELGAAQHDDSAVTVSPAVLDCCLQLAAAPAGGSPLRIPAGVSLLLLGSRAGGIAGHGGKSMLAISQPSTDYTLLGGDATFTDYRLARSVSGAAVCSVCEMEARPMGSSAARRKPAPKRYLAAAAVGPPSTLRQEDWLYALDWLAYGSSGRSAAASVAQAVLSASLGVTSVGSCTDVAAAGIAIVQQAAAGSSQGMALITQGGQLGVAAGLDGRPGASGVQAAGLWGLARTVAQELTAVAMQAVDMQRQAVAGTAAAFLALLVPQQPDKLADLLPGEAQVQGSPYGHSVQGGSLLAAVLQRSTIKPMLAPFQLFPQPRGALQNLAPLPVDASAAALAPGQVLVAVRAVGINFRDVLNVLGMYPGDPGPPGGDCAGVVVAAGAGVHRLKPGDAVFGLAGGSLGSHVRCNAQTVTQVNASKGSLHLCLFTSGSPAKGHATLTCLLSATNVVQMPGNLDFEAASTTPTVCITVDCAFRQSAMVRPGDRVLVHAAAGGVGIAAMQLIDALGGTTVATAGSSNKRALVRSLGPSQVLGSRDTAFVSELAEVGGASVVLNSLTSSGMVAGSLAALSAGGRFVEISKRDIWSAARVAQGG